MSQHLLTIDEIHLAHSVSETTAGQSQCPKPGFQNIHPKGSQNLQFLFLRGGLCPTRCHLLGGTVPMLLSEPTASEISEVPSQEKVGLKIRWEMNVIIHVDYAQL